MKEAHEQEDEKISRRSFILGGASTIAVGAVGVKSYMDYVDRDKNEHAIGENIDDEVVKAEDTESIEEIPNSKAFEAQKEGFKKWWTISFNEAQFLNEDGSPAGEPVPLDDIQPENISVGKKDENGLIYGGIAKDWLTYHRGRLGLDMQAGEGKVKHTTIDFEKALKTNDEPMLVQSIKDAAAGRSGISTMVDIVRYYGMNTDKIVRGDTKERTRSVYLQEEITFHNKVPKLVQDELRGFIVGLVAQESRFNAGMKKNIQTAWGAMQLTDIVRGEHDYPPDQKLSFKQEVDVAGKHCSNIYTRVRHWMKNELVRKNNGKLEKKTRPETYEVLRSMFPEGQDGDKVWQKYFLTPCMINAYNAGEWTIGACLHEFVADHTKEELQNLLGEPPGYDLFTAFTKFAKENKANEFTENYGDDSSEYFVSIVAATEVV